MGMQAALATADHAEHVAGLSRLDSDVQVALCVTPAPACIHPLYWMHLCNLDRLYCSYASVRPISEVAARFECNQRRLLEQGAPGTSVYSMSLPSLAAHTTGEP